MLACIQKQARIPVRRLSPTCVFFLSALSASFKPTNLLTFGLLCEVLFAHTTQVTWRLKAENSSLTFMSTQRCPHPQPCMFRQYVKIQSKCYLYITTNQHNMLRQHVKSQCKCYMYITTNQHSM